MTRARDSVDPTGGDVIAVLTWLSAHPVPAGPSRAFEAWEMQARRIGTAAIPALLHGLEFGPLDVQYTAQQVLRLNGIDVWGHGYGRDFHYTVTSPGESERTVRPLLTDDAVEASGTRSTVAEQAMSYGDDPYARIEAAGRAIEERRAEMGALGRARSEAVRDLLRSGVSRAEIARRLGVHPNYVNQLAARADTEGPAEGPRRT